MPRPCCNCCSAPCCCRWPRAGLSRRTARGRAALIVAALGGVAGAVLGGIQIALAAFAWSGAMGYLGATPGLLPGSLEEAGRLVKDSPRRWWR